LTPAAAAVASVLVMSGGQLVEVPILNELAAQEGSRFSRLRHSMATKKFGAAAAVVVVVQ
jgi:hypothetical protein